MDKLTTLANAARFDVCGGGCGGNTREVSPLNFIHQAALPNGGTVPLFKVLLTNICVNDCAYCVNQIGRDIARCSFQSEELARVFMEMHAKRMVKGLFLSSGIGCDASRTMESMIKTVEILRYRHRFNGYIHMKILPGARFDCVEAGCKLASRVSVNIEAPTAGHLAVLSRKKDLRDGILERMRWVKQIKSEYETLVPSGQTTQFVVGAAGESDRDILNTSQNLYKEMGLKRVYFSAFHPIAGSRLEGVNPAPPMREHRLYEVDWLHRVYGFSPGEVALALGKNGNLPLTRDPKLVIAQRQPWLFPVDINKASYEELLRVPGIGPVSAKRIIETRRETSISSVQQLKKIRVVTGHAVPFIWFRGMLAYEKQLSFLPQLDKEADEEEIEAAAGVGNGTYQDIV
ncbi:MAG: putative DNA modification/repair radical SAM protein [Dehalococcoidia bacterium]|nr:MAG: putative DNA modification/repair radical SAM protein [Dehalococcoidia bacterium]